MKEKICSQCKEVKPINEFHKRKMSIDGLNAYCKPCNLKEVKSYSRTKPGLITKIYSRQKKSSKKRGHKPPTYSKQEFSDFCFASPMFHKLYSDWVYSGFDKMKAPSFDRKNDYEGYSFNNFNRWMTWKDNFDKGHTDRKNGINNKRSKTVIGTHKLTGETIEFHSQMEAQRETGISHSNISACCLGKRKSAGGYIWRFSET